MAKFKKSLLHSPWTTMRVHFQYQRGYMRFRFLRKVGFKHGLYM